jgi:orotate phosphoribosyltransferase
MDPEGTERLCRAFVQRIGEAYGPVDDVVSPEVGGIVPGYETARHPGARQPSWGG